MFTFSNGKWAVTANGSPLLRYVKKLTQVIKLNTAGFLRIQRYNKKILNRILKKHLK